VGETLVNISGKAASMWEQQQRERIAKSVSTQLAVDAEKAAGRATSVNESQTVP